MNQLNVTVILWAMCQFFLNKYLLICQNPKSTKQTPWCKLVTLIFKFSPNFEWTIGLVILPKPLQNVVSESVCQVESSGKPWFSK